MKQEYALVLDWETSGIPEQEVPTRTFLEGPQGIEIGAILVKLPDFTYVGEYESRVRFLGTAHGVAYGGPIYEGIIWNNEAQKIHGISVDALVDVPTPTVVAGEFVTWINSYVESTTSVMICGYNPAFDHYFTRQLLFLGAAETQLRINHRMIDAFSLAYMVLGSKSSDDLFYRTSGAIRKNHSAIEDARLTLNAFRHIYEEVKREK